MSFAMYQESAYPLAHMCSIGHIDKNHLVLYYIGLIVLVFVALVLGLLLSVWIFLKCWSQRTV
jgi:hypothetical protein